MSSTESVSPDDVIVCACGTHEYTARDAIDAAMFRGELEEKWQTFLRHVAAEEHADELELELDESAISTAAEERGGTEGAQNRRDRRRLPDASGRLAREPDDRVRDLGPAQPEARQRGPHLHGHVPARARRV